MAKRKAVSYAIREEEEEEEEQEEEEEEDEEEDEEEVEEEVEEEEEEEEEEQQDDDSSESAEEENPEGEKGGLNREVEDEDFSSKECIRKILEPFGKDQLIEILKEAALKHPPLLSRITSSAEADSIHRNLFVFGLGWDVTAETLTAVFSPYGELEDCKVVADRTTGRCKGYGFVLFRSRAAAERALKAPQKKIGGRTTTCQLASFGNQSAGGKVSTEAAGRKIFVSNIGSNVDPERLLAFFSKFGEIEEGPLGYDPTTGMLRGFAIFVYKTAEGCRKALQEPKKYFEGCELQCRRAFEGGNKNIGHQTTPVMGSETAPAVLQPNDLALSYASAAAMMGQNLSAGTTPLMGQHAGIGLLNPAAGVSPTLTRVGTGTVTPANVVGSTVRGSGVGINSVSPSIIGSYGSFAALQGLGAYQNTQSTMTRSQSGVSSLGGTGLPPYFGQ